MLYGGVRMVISSKHEARHTPKVQIAINLNGRNLRRINPREIFKAAEACIAKQSADPFVQITAKPVKFLCELGNRMYEMCINVWSRVVTGLKRARQQFSEWESVRTAKHGFKRCSPSSIRNCRSYA